MDDLITMKNQNFQKNIRNIFPAELELIKENQINKVSSFLDLNFEMQNCRFQLNENETNLILI